MAVRCCCLQIQHLRAQVNYLSEDRDQKDAQVWLLCLCVPTEPPLTALLCLPLPDVMLPGLGQGY